MKGCQKRDLPVHEGGVKYMTYRCKKAVSGWSWSSTPSTAPSPDHIADTGLMESKSQSTCLRENRPCNLKYRGIFCTVVDAAVPQNDEITLGQKNGLLPAV